MTGLWLSPTHITPDLQLTPTHITPDLQLTPTHITPDLQLTPTHITLMQQSLSRSGMLLVTITNMVNGYLVTAVIQQDH